MICPPSYLWDLAAGLPFTRALGMIEVGLDGTLFALKRVLHDPRYRMDEPLLIGRAAEVERLLACLRG
jgi:hypothetical protein